MTRLLRIGYGAALGFLLLLLARPVLAQKEDGCSLSVDSDPKSAVTFEGLAALLTSDLGKRVQASGGNVALFVRYRDHKLTVRADHGGRVLERTIDVDEANAERQASLLASNLARDEARELLDDLAARPPVPAPVPSSEPAPPPPAPPAPAPPPRNVYASAGLLYPVATSHGEPDARAYLEVSLLFGRMGSVKGLQLGAVASHASRRVDGVQLDSVAGITGDLDGAQVAGVATIATSEVHGVQAAGVLAYAGEIDGVQAATVDIAKEVRGVQLGVVNVGKRVKGAQIGLINIADEVEGTQLGLVSVSRNGVHPVLYATNLAYSNFGIKFETRFVYTELALTFGTLESQYDNAGVTSAMGGRVPLDVLLPGLDVEPETYLTFVSPRTASADNNLWLGGRVFAGYSFARHLRIFAGGGVRFPLIVHFGREVARPEAIAGVEL